MKELTTRVLVSIVGIPAILFLIYIGGIGFTLFIAIVALIGQYEFYSLLKEKETNPSTWIALICGGLWILGVYFFSQYIFNIMLAIFLGFFPFKFLEDTVSWVGASVKSHKSSIKGAKFPQL